MLKPPPPTTKTKAKTKAKSQPSDDDKDSELHKYAAPGEHIEIPAWKRSGLVMKVENAHYGPDGGRRYLVSHNPDDEKGSWYQLEPHHFHNNDNPDHKAVVRKYAQEELTKAVNKASDIHFDTKGDGKLRKKISNDDEVSNHFRQAEMKKAYADHLERHN